MTSFITFYYKGQQFIMLKKKKDLKSLLCACNDIDTTPVCFGSVVSCVCARKHKSCVWVTALEPEVLFSGFQEARSVTSSSSLSSLLFCCVG